jgi:hypothetical protein
VIESNAAALQETIKQLKLKRLDAGRISPATSFDVVDNGLLEHERLTAGQVLAIERASSHTAANLDAAILELEEEAKLLALTAPPARSTVAGKAPQQPEIVPPEAVAATEVKKESELERGMRRQRLLLPYLKPRALTLNQWALDAHVDWHTVNNYWIGKTNLRPKTEEKLAKILRLNLGDMPE